MKELSNVEFMLLQIVFEKGEVSGYEINQLVKERGYREWADIGTTSIYIGLNKLTKKHLLDSFIATGKQGKGPIPRKFTINNDGKKALKQEIIYSLSYTRERDHRFDLALGASPFLSPEEVVTALEKRKQFLSEATHNIEQKLSSQGGNHLPFHVKALFEHPLFLIKHEISFMDNLIGELKRRDTHDTYN
ncbi:MAG TPA: helix-turn-helix transcriptional regulator [Bacillota bacterium]|nr:helix-turn-helix transcriptional regulator [Bacillota bacterium]